MPGETPSRTDALTLLVQGWMIHSGPVTADELGGRLGVESAEIHEALLRLEATGVVLRGRFRSPLAPDVIEWG